MNNRFYDTIKRLLVIASLCVLSVGCDGGIFGTGDGTDPLIVNGVSASNGGASISDIPNSTVAGSDETNSDTPNGVATDETANEDTDGADDSSDNLGTQTPAVEIPASENSTLDPSNMIGFTTEFIATENSVVTNNPQLSFTNAVVIEDALTRVTLVNDTDIAIALFTSRFGTESASVALSSNLSNSGSLPPTTDALYVDEISGNERISNLFVIDPLTVAEGSNTLVIVSNTEAGVRLLVLPSYNASVTNDAVPLRFVFPFLAGDPEVPSVITLTPNATSASAANTETVTFNAISNDLPITNFQNVPPGEYLLNDDAGRYTDISISVSDGTSTNTLIFKSDGTSDFFNIEL